MSFRNPEKNLSARILIIVIIHPRKEGVSTTVTVCDVSSDASSDSSAE